MDSPLTPDERSTFRQAWIDTRMEKDRTLLNLAAGGLGLLVTLLTTVGVLSSFQLGVYAFAGLAFLTTIVTAVRIFGRNAKHLEDVLSGANLGDDDVLVRLDFILLASFLLGVAGLGIIAAESGWTNYQTRRRTTVAESTENKAGSPDHIRSLTGAGRTTTSGGSQQGNNSGTQQQGSSTTNQAGTTGGGK